MNPAGWDLRAKLLVLAGLLAAGFATDLAGLALLLLATEGLLLASGLARRQRLVLAAALLALPFALLNAALHGAEPLASVGGVSLYREGLAAGLGFAGRGVLAVMAGLWVAGSTPPRAAFALLHRWPRLAVAVAGTLRFAPLAADDLARIREAQALRGHRLGRGARGALGLAPLMVPLFVGTVRRGQALQEALDAAAFGSGPRTRRPLPALRAPDAPALALGAALLGLAALRALRAGGMA